ncbi:dCTP deaminase [bacterium MnTg02]|nr:dCTP deaminase [bacterium MnTg02]
MLNSSELAKKISLGKNADENGLSIIPAPQVTDIEESGESSVTLRLGRWLVALRQSSQTFFDVADDKVELRAEARAAKFYFIQFGNKYVLHPNRFVLGSTLEWIKLPATLGAYITGKSTWARRGLIIETAAGIHPGFSGCLTLELTNVGEVPIIIRSGMKICQIFPHNVSGGEYKSHGPLTGRRRPYLGAPSDDPLYRSLAA